MHQNRYILPHTGICRWTADAAKGHLLSISNSTHTDATQHRRIVFLDPRYRCGWLCTARCVDHLRVINTQKTVARPGIHTVQVERRFSARATWSPISSRWIYDLVYGDDATDAPLLLVHLCLQKNIINVMYTEVCCQFVTVFCYLCRWEQSPTKSTINQALPTDMNHPLGTHLSTNLCIVQVTWLHSLGSLVINARYLINAFSILLLWNTKSEQQWRKCGVGGLQTNYTLCIVDTAVTTLAGRSRVIGGLDKNWLQSKTEPTRWRGFIRSL